MKNHKLRRALRAILKLLPRIVTGFLLELRISFFPKKKTKGERYIRYICFYYIREKNRLKMRR